MLLLLSPSSNSAGFVFRTNIGDRGGLSTCVLVVILIATGRIAIVSRKVRLDSDSVSVPCPGRAVRAAIIVKAIPCIRQWAFLTSRIIFRLTTVGQFFMQYKLGDIRENVWTYRRSQNVLHIILPDIQC